MTLYGAKVVPEGDSASSDRGWRLYHPGSTHIGVLWTCQSTLRPRVEDSGDRKRSEAQLEEGIRNYFDGRVWIDLDTGIVMGEAKGIVQRFSTERDVFMAVGKEIEKMKKEDNNWTFANRLQSARALVQFLGLSSRTSDKNKIFLEMTLPAIPPVDPLK